MAEIKSGSSTDKLTIDAASKAGRFTPYATNGVEQFYAEGANYTNTARGLIQAGINDDNIRHFRTDRTGGIASALVAPLFYEFFEGTALASNRWNVTAATMAATQTDTGLVFNSGNITTASTGYLYTSLKRFIKVSRAPLHCKIRARLDHRTNAVEEFGFGNPPSFNGATPVGAYFQVTAGGVLQPVLTYNGVDITGASIPYSTSNFYTFDIILDDDEATFYVQDTSTGLILNEQSLRLPITQNKLWNASHLSVYARLYTTGVAPASAPQLILSETFVGVLDTVLNKPWPLVAAQIGLGGTYNPVTFAQTENNTNSTTPTSATLSNTTAFYTTFGGRYSFAAVAGAATDYCLFAAQVPTGYQYVCNGIDFEVLNTGAAVATTPTVLDWSIAHNGGAASLADTLYRKRSLGFHSLPIGAVVGAKAERISCSFEDTPIVTESGRFFAIALRMPIATATASQVIQGIATPRGFFE
jgi:hypothetical protein